MKEIKIEHLAYLLKQAKEHNQPQPIFFLGAGASRSGNIPLAGEIITYILSTYSESPFIKDLLPEKRTYANLMDCLSPNQRDELLKGYINKAKINVTHIYLAQLLKEGFADYVLSVNFDNLMLRALALYNIFPATYDMAILKDLTTTTFKEKSVVYLHGQSHGLWLLNTPEELEKVKTIVQRIFDSIKNKRPWVFIGYSGEDPVFEHIKSLGRFDNGLYWVTHNDKEPNENVKSFLITANTNASIIKGFDSDSFMLKLNSELGLGQPNIVDKPFTALKEMVEEIVDIEDKDHFKGVKERLEISKRQINEAIQQHEQGIIESGIDLKENTELDLLKKEIINLIISESYNENIISDIEKRAKRIHNNNLQSLLSGLYSDWGIYLGNMANSKNGAAAEELYNQAFEKYQKAIEIKPDNNKAWYNWGNYLGNLAKTKEGAESEALFLESFEKYQKAIEINPVDNESYFNWGTYLGNLAKTKEGAESEALFLQSFEKYQKAIEINPADSEAYNNWGTDLANLAKTKEGAESEALFLQSFEKYQKAIEINPADSDAYNNWGTDLGNFAKTKEGVESETFFLQSFEKYQKAIELNPEDIEAYNNWGTDLGHLARTKKGNESEMLFLECFEKYQKAIKINPGYIKAYNNWGTYLGNLAKRQEGDAAEELFRQAFEKLQKAIELGGESYNLACCHALKNNKKEALFYLDLSLSNREVLVNFVKDDEDWQIFSDDMDFKNTIEKYTK